MKRSSMLYTNRIILTVAIVGVLICPISTFSANGFDASARSVAMGYSGVAFMSQQGAFYNPGTLGLYYADRPFSSFSSLSSNYNPGWLPSSRLPGISSGTSENIGFNSFGERAFEYTSFGLGLRVYDRQLERYRYRMTIAVTYSGVALDIPYRSYTTENYLDIFYRSREPLNSPEPIHDRVDMFTVALGLKGTFNIGFGGTLKLLRGEWDSQNVTSAAFDLGLIVSRSWNIGNPIDGKRYILTPAVGVSAFNIGGDTKLPESNYALTRRINYGASWLWEMKSQSRTDISLLMTVERSEQSNTSNRQSTTGRPDTRQNPSGVIYGGTEFDFDFAKPNHFRLGYELGLYETVYLRTSQYGNDLHNFGFGVRPLALARVLKIKSGLIGWMTKHFEISYDFARVDKLVKLESNQHQLSLSLR